MNFYAYKRLFCKVLVFSKFLFLIRLVFFAFCLCEVAFTFSLRLNFLSSYMKIFSGYLLALSFILFNFALLYDVILLILRPVNRTFNIKRREFLRSCFDVSIIITSFSYFLKGAFNALRLPSVKHQKVFISGLKKPLKLVALTDIHLGNFLGVEFASDLVKRVNELNADIIVIVGDMADLSADSLRKVAAPFKDFTSKFGTFFVPGNHEYYNGIEGALVVANELGFKILGNKNVQIGGVNLAGVYDLAGIKFKKFEPNLQESLLNIDTNLPTILLSHQPKFVKSMDKNVDLVISGHTHGGQIFPFSLLVKLDQPFLAGLYQVNDKMQIYVSRGAGFWGPPVRILAPSEITLLELRNVDEK